MIRNQALLFALAISVSACGKGPVPGAEQVDAGPVCEAGALSCTDKVLSVCTDGTFEFAETCVVTCSTFEGCIGEAVCRVADVGLDAPPICTEKAQPDSFSPELQWIWPADGSRAQAYSSPLVANLTDDNGDGEINLCDTPDVVLTAQLGSDSLSRRDPAVLVVLDGQTGLEHFRIEGNFHRSISPALGDVDGDQIADIIAGEVSADSADAGALVAYNHLGELLWRGPVIGESYAAIALADLDNDGDVEILVDELVIDHLGNVLFETPAASGIDDYGSTTIAADLDGDGDLEVVVGQAAYHHDGTEYYHQATIEPGHVAIADLDNDGLPEVVITNRQGVGVLENDGAIQRQDMRPFLNIPTREWMRPVTIHNFDNLGGPEIAMGAYDTFGVFRPNGTRLWGTVIEDLSGAAAGTAFDFLGDGLAEAMYGDESRLYVYDEAGSTLLDVPRVSVTSLEYPVVADIDNDGSAEILVVSNHAIGDDQAGPFAIQAIRDTEDRWVGTRRIWNQHSYHVTNVREDGTIPQYEQPWWLGLNTFRTNAQVDGGELCGPRID